MDDDHGALDAVENADFDLLSPAAEFTEHRVLLIGDLQQPVSRVEDALADRLRVGNANDLYLTDHHRVGGVGRDLPMVADKFCQMTGRGDDGGFLNRHGNQIILIIDEEVRRQTERHAEDADDVLDHLVGDVHGQGFALELVNFLGRQMEQFHQAIETLRNGEFVETGQAGRRPVIIRTHRASSSDRRCVTHSSRGPEATSGATRSAARSRHPVSTITARRPLMTESIHCPTASPPPS